MLNRWSFLLATMLATSASQATHIIGGELYYDYVSSGQYQLTLKLYRDCDGIDFDASVVIGVFNADDFSFFTSTTLTFPGEQDVPIVLDSPCLTAPPDICVRTTLYTGPINLPPSPAGYILVYQRCCRTGIISNLQNPQDLGLTLVTTIPGQAVPINSSPRFTLLPPIALCLNAPLAFDHSATDPDGDQLVYSLTTPYNGGTNGNPQPNPPDPPPYVPVPWLTPTYSETYPIDSDPAIAIDAATGLLTLTPTLQGNFTIGVMVQEFRDGVLIGEQRRDFLFKAVSCDLAVTAAVLSQAAGSDPLCDDLTEFFTNLSSGAQTYWWDFGDPNSTDDTSDAFEPQWTYLEPGTYSVTLVANPGEICTDTTVGIFDVYLPPEPLINPPPPACGNDPVTLMVEGNFGPNATFQWQLGGGSVPPNANTQEVTVQFSATGTHEVAVTVGENGCTGFTTAQVVNSPQPVAGYTVFPPSPQLVGTSIIFTDASNANGGQVTSWSWTIEDDSYSASTASATWLPDSPGTYHITLTVVDAEGCTDQITFDYVVIGGPIRIPNVFSPNGDDHNETFHIENVEQYHNELWVYNRWGSKVFTANNYKNQWDGDGVPDGTYYYVLRIDNGDEYAGHVTLLR